MSQSAYWCIGPTLSLASPARGFAAEMVTVSRRPWLFRVPHGFIKTVARCVRCFQRCFMRYFFTVQNAQASFSTSPAGAGWIHVLNLLFAYLGAPADTRNNSVKRSLWQFAVICLLIGNGKISKCFCCTVSRCILLRKKLEQQFETSGGDECDWPGPRNWSWAARASALKDGGLEWLEDSSTSSISAGRYWINIVVDCTFGVGVTYILLQLSMRCTG